MKMRWNQENVKENFGDVYFIGVKVKRDYDRDLDEQDQRIKSISVNIGVDMMDEPLTVNVVRPTKDYEFKNDDIPNIKKWGKVRFEGLEYAPRALGNHSANDNGSDFVWGTLEENFNALKVLPATPADRKFDEKTGELLTDKKPALTENK